MDLFQLTVRAEPFQYSNSVLTDTGTACYAAQEWDYQTVLRRSVVGLKSCRGLEVAISRKPAANFRQQNRY